MFVAWSRSTNEEFSFKDWITFDVLTEHRGGGFDTSSGIYTVPEDGIYIFGLRANSGKSSTWTKIAFCRNDKPLYLVVFEGNMGNIKDNYNNLGSAWTDTLKKGDKVRLQVDRGTVNALLSWWGVRINA